MPDTKSIYTTIMPNIVPGVYGDATVSYIDESDSYSLEYKGVPWMSTDREFIHAKDTLHSQFDLAYGDVLVTGLGFGILTKALSQKEEVSSITVVERESDIIHAYLMHNSLDDKISIVHGDASTYTSLDRYDCVLPDHYELQNFEWKIEDMNNLASRIKHSLFWPWSIEELFLDKNYPRHIYTDEHKTQVIYDESSVFGEHLEELPAKWDEFIVEHFAETKTLPTLSIETLLEYLKKSAKHYYRD